MICRRGCGVNVECACRFLNATSSDVFVAVYVKSGELFFIRLLEIILKIDILVEEKIEANILKKKKV